MPHEGHHQRRPRPHGSHRGQGRGGARGRGRGRGKSRGRGRGRGGSNRRRHDYGDTNMALQPHRQLFDRVVQDPAKVLRSQSEVNNFLSAIKDHDDPFKLLYDLNQDHGQRLLRSVTAYLDPMLQNQARIILPHLQPVLERFSRAEFGAPALEHQLSGVICAISEAPYLFRFLTAFVKQPPSVIQPEDERKQLLEVLSWLVVRVATARRARGETAKLQCTPGLQELVDTLCSLDLPFVDFLRGHMAEPDSKENISLDALQDDSLVPFRDISVVPTIEDLRQREPGQLPKPPFDKNCDMLVDAQFRLLREALLGPARDELKPKKRRSFRTLFQVQPIRLYASQHRAAITFSFNLHKNHPCLRKGKKERIEFWERTHLLQRGSLVLLLRDDEPLHLAEVATRDPKELADKKAPVVHLSLLGKGAVSAVLKELPDRAKRLHYTMVMVAPNFFAFEPVLRRLQRITRLPFKEELLGRCPPAEERVSPFWTREAQQATSVLAKDFTLNMSQDRAVRHAMENRVALVQGPPGTGKSFIGIVMAKLLLRTCNARLLLCCYTNHALDQFLTELLEHRVTNKIVRIGGRCKEERLQEYCLHNIRRGKANWTRAQQARYHELKDERETLQGRAQRLGNAVSRKMGVKWWNRTIEPFLREHYVDAHAALTIPDQAQGFQPVGRDGNPIDNSYLWERWYNGQDGGIFKQDRSDNVFWQTDKAARRALFNAWEEEIRGPQRDDLAELMQRIENITREIDELRRVDRKAILDDAEVIACTTWGAARYNDLLQQQDLPVVMVEEAGEVLEAHLLTALPRECRHLILIGDHQQLRPKVDHHPLTKEANRGYNLNVSLFERLAGTLPVATLDVQHRMRPKFSGLVRGLFYPQLEDHASTRGRENVLGLEHNLVVVHHDHLETAAQKKMAQHQSHSNEHEVGMVKATVRYLLQQNYLPERIVVLTPYLGQLLELRTALADVTDEVGVAMDERDLADARQAGADLDTSVYHEAVGTQKTIRVATIDNFQGEEADLIVVSLVRSNTAGNGGYGKIGFLEEPNRVNVMLSRARLGMILFGNMATFTSAEHKDARSMWQKLMQKLIPRACIKDGLPVRCQQHPEEKHILRTPADFDTHAADGGCRRKCASVLPCGHECPLRCHSTEHKHATIKCNFEVHAKCEQQTHVQVWLCHEKQPPCSQCAETKQLRERLKRAEEQRERQRNERESKLERARLQIQARHSEQMAELEKKDADEEYRAKKEELEALLSKELRELEERKAEEEAKAKDKYLASLKRYEGDLRKIRRQQAQRARDAEQKLLQRRAELARKVDEAKQEAEAREQADQQRLQATLAAEQERLAQLKAQLQRTEAAREEELRALRKRMIQEERRKQQREEAKLRRAHFEGKAEKERLEGERDAVVSEEHECCICFDIKVVVGGILCSKEEHFVCDECFDCHVRVIATRDERLAIGSEVKCPGVGCESAAYDQRQIAEHVSSGTFERLQKLEQELAESRISREADRRVEQEVERRLAMSERERQVQRHRRHILDGIFNLACPRCKAVFADFDGCFALTCQQCDCHFCAWCLRDCGRDAHRCAAECGRQYGAGGYYGTREQFGNHHRQRRQRLLDEYLRGIQEEAVRVELIEACRGDAADLGLHLPAPPPDVRRQQRQQRDEQMHQRQDAPAAAQGVRLDHAVQEEIDRQLAEALQRAL